VSKPKDFDKENRMTELNGKTLKDQIARLETVWDLLDSVDRACRGGLRIIREMEIDDAVAIGPKFLAEQAPKGVWLRTLCGGSEIATAKIARLEGLTPESTVKQVRRTLSDTLDFAVQTVLGWIKKESMEAGLVVSERDFKVASARPEERGPLFRRLQNKLGANDKERIRQEKLKRAATHERERRAEVERLHGEINQCLGQLGFGSLPKRECKTLEEVEAAIKDYAAQLARYDARLCARRRATKVVELPSPPKAGNDAVSASDEHDAVEAK
jgi:hypothetical protein